MTVTFERGDNLNVIKKCCGVEITCQAAALHHSLR